MYKYLAFLLSLICLFHGLKSGAQEYVEISYSDTYESFYTKGQNLSMAPKIMRSNSGSSTIAITSDAELDEQTTKVVDYVKSVWEAHIVNGVKLFVKIELADDITEDIQTIVRYHNKNGIAIPLALYAYLDSPQKRDSTNVDGIIRINSNDAWDYALGDNILPTGKNLAYGIMRAMARIMGFGSNISINENGDFFFSDKRYHSIFNTLIYNSSNQPLKDLNINKGRPNPQLKSYIENPNQTFWVYANNGKYKLASPPFSRNNLPFVYLEFDENNPSLMNAKLSAGNYILQIDETTRDILNSIGWNTQAPPAIKIVGEDIPETGLASAYESHRFTIEHGNGSLYNPQWTLNLPGVDGEVYSIALTDENLACTIKPITDEIKYKINADGDIEAQLTFSCTSNGQEIKAQPFKIHFELKPLIEYATILNIHDNAPYASYDASYKVKYRGAEKIKVSVEEEFGSKVKSCYINEPYIAYGVADHITSPFYAWIDFVAENKYGKSTYTIELQPYGNVNRTTEREDIRINSDIDNETFDAYTVTGVKLGTFKSLSQIRSLSYDGMLIVRCMHGNRLIETFKMISK